MIASSSRPRSPSPPSTPHRRRRTRRSVSAGGVQLRRGSSATHDEQPPRSESQVYSQSQTYSPPAQRFSRLFNTVLGSPFLTTSDPEYFPPDLEFLDGSPTAVPRNYTVTRPSSPTPTADFSIIGHDEFDGYTPDVFLSYNTFPGRRVTGYSRIYSGLAPSISTPHFSPSSYPSTHQSPLRSLLRIWETLSSPAKHLSSSQSAGSSRSGSPRGFTSSSNRHTLHGCNFPTPIRGKGKGKAPVIPSFTEDADGSSAAYIDYSELPPLDGEEGELIDDEACFIDIRAVTGIDILTLLPIELALDILCQLDKEDALPTIISCLSVSKAWRALASDNSVWRSMFLQRWGINLKRAKARKVLKERKPEIPFDLAADTLRGAPLRRAGAIFPGRILSSGSPHPQPSGPTSRIRRATEWEWKRRSMSVGSIAGPSSGPSKAARIGLPAGFRLRRSPVLTSAPIIPPLVDRVPSTRRRRASTSSIGTTYTFLPPPAQAPLTLDWRNLFRERYELEKRWAGTARNPPPEPPLPSPIPTPQPGTPTVGNGPLAPASPLPSPSLQPNTSSSYRPNDIYEPKVLRLSGHRDSVYCLEFDSRRIITGSRDQTVRVWSIKTGKCLGVFWGVHTGSVLCLKFEGDWEDKDEGDDATGSLLPGPSTGSSQTPRKGFMVTGSSDCNVIVWELETVSAERDVFGRQPPPSPLPKDAEEKNVAGTPVAWLTGHTGGVLDLRIDQKWIVSCSKDAVIRVWNRETLTPHRTLRGHEGPVNAVGLQGERVVSASGDGKMILWDIESGERLRTFEGHDRGLACIEFKDDLIVSGSNDCKIKIWSAKSGECLKTLVGHEALVRALSFDPRNGRLVSASYDKTIKLWDLATGKMVREFKNIHTSHIFDVKFDVARIVSTSHDQKIVVLDFSHGLDTSLFL
ncbi:hypothetical protein AX16_006789 [Volvariella volvacea WC 439]|nr:hypothetical protein AX16_006789 [Volvariella volvacea WC 439]